MDNPDFSGRIIRSSRRGFLGSPLPSWLWALVTLCIAFIVLAELYLDLDRHQLLHTAVVAVDSLLVAGFAIWIAWDGYRNRMAMGEWIVHRRIDLLLLAISVPLVLLVPRAGAVAIVGRVSLSALWILARWWVGRPGQGWSLSPSQTLALSFLGLIGIGSVLLLFPAATVDGQGARVVDAVFTMASATSVTGLVVQDTGTYWTPFGLGVIVCVMQVGAIGIMVLAAAFAVLVGGLLPGRQLDGLAEAGFGDVVELSTLEGLQKLTLSIAGATVLIEVIGALLLYGLWAVDLMPLRPHYDSAGMAAWWCLFHSISAFCHAGFSLEPDSLVRWVDSPVVGNVFVVLITLGGIGFPVLADIFSRPRQRERFKKRGFWEGSWDRFHIQTKVVLVTTVGLYVLGGLMFLFLEFDGALAGQSIPTKINAAFFQSVTLRSAGFNTVSWSTIAAPTVIMSLVFMFIGSAPASTGGGIRVTTAAVTVMAVRAMLRGRNDVEVFGRTLAGTIVYRSISIALVAGVLVASGVMLVTATQGHLPFDKLLFETFSAFGTVGLSMGITSELNDVGRWIMAALMYFGRVGPLTLALAVAEKPQPQTYRYPDGRMAVG